MGVKLVTEDYRLIQRLKREGVLRRVNGPLLVGRNTTIITVLCADGTYSDDKLSHLRRFVAHVHPLTDLSGALWLDPEFRDNAYDDEEWRGVQKRLIQRLTRSVEMKRTNRILPMVHYKCGEACGIYGYGILELLDALVRAHLRIKYVVQEFVNEAATALGNGSAATRIRVPPLFHYADGEERQTVWVNPDHWHFRHLAKWRRVYALPARVKPKK